MDWIEQAVFTSAETDRSAGYQVVATSPGVSEADARELAVWGPSHNALLEPSPSAVSYNFHPLSGGSYCVGRTTSAGWEYSGRGGARIYTQCLIVPPSTLARFANNPFALLRAALAAGVLLLHDKVPERLEPLRLAGRAAVVDQALLARLCANPGPDWLASLVQAALTSATVAVTAGPSAEHLIAGLVNCLPPECRLQFSFSTGLKFSSRRPFRVIALSEDEEERHRVKRLYDVAVLDFSGQVPSEFTPMESWARFIQRALRTRRTSFLANRLSRRQCEFAPEDLPALGLQLLEELDASSLAGDEADADGGDGRASEGASEDREWLDQLPDEEPTIIQLPDEDTWIGQTLYERLLPRGLAASRDDASADPTRDDQPGLSESPPSRAHQRPHEPHARVPGECCPRTAARRKASAPSHDLDLDDPDVLERLEHLDDLVYDAVAGKPDAMDRLKNFWPQVRDDLGEEILAESQGQYLRYALSTWIESIEPDEVRDPSRAVQSLEVLCVLFDQM
ncbi:MAG TPA: hypothetical protein VMY37_29850 [Thermoguttaceae bacterium]|nr:hypothetical protein [Thermoguttaceae bacterium]